MIHIVLDTSIYREKPRLDSREFKLITYLSEKEVLKLHLPYFVELEFKTEIEKIQEGRIKRAIKSLESTINYSFAGRKTQELVDILDSISGMKEDLIAERGSSFLKWIADINAIRYPLDEDETKKAIDAYFKGNPPLKEPKVRNDIPDSFIFQTIESLRRKYKSELHAIIKDKKLREACESSGITCFKSLSDFLEIEKLQEFLRYKLIDDNSKLVFDHIVKLLKPEESKTIDLLESILLSDDYRIISGGSVPGINNEIYVSGVERPHHLEYDDMFYFGGSLFILPFSALVEMTYEFPLFHHDVYDLDQENYSIEYVDKNIFNVETTDVFRFSGSFELDFNDIDPELHDIGKLIDNLKNHEISVGDLEDFEID